MDHMARGIRRQIRRRGREGFSCADRLFGDAEFMVRAGGIKWLVYHPWLLVPRPLRSRPGYRGQVLETEPSGYNLSQEPLDFIGGSSVEFPAVEGEELDPNYMSPTAKVRTQSGIRVRA